MSTNRKKCRCPEGWHETHIRHMKLPSAEEVEAAIRRSQQELSQQLREAERERLRALNEHRCPCCQVYG